jgi:ubiquinone/menaquinone biosynthesis C-methylase UbiE
LTEKDFPSNKKRELMNLYDATASIYDERYRIIQNRKYEYVKGSPNKRDTLLDVGCGTGLFFRNFGVDVGQLVGVDMSIRMLKTALRNLRKAGQRVDLIRVDADFLPFRERTFNKVISVTVLQNMPQPLETIREIARVTSVGGKVALTCLKKKHDLQGLKTTILSSATGLDITSEWDNGEEDIGVSATKLI